MRPGSTASSSGLYLTVSGLVCFTEDILCNNINRCLATAIPGPVVVARSIPGINNLSRNYPLGRTSRECAQSRTMLQTECKLVNQQTISFRNSVCSRASGLSCAKSHRSHALDRSTKIYDKPRANSSFGIYYILQPNRRCINSRPKRDAGRQE